MLLQPVLDRAPQQERLQMLGCAARQVLAEPSLAPKNAAPETKAAMNKEFFFILSFGLVL